MNNKILIKLIFKAIFTANLNHEQLAFILRHIRSDAKRIEKLGANTLEIIQSVLQDERFDNRLLFSRIYGQYAYLVLIQSLEKIHKLDPSLIKDYLFISIAALQIDPAQAYVLCFGLPYCVDSLPSEVRKETVGKWRRQAEFIFSKKRSFTELCTEIERYFKPQALKNHCI